jgi:hypothetical protein
MDMLPGKTRRHGAKGRELMRMMLRIHIDATHGSAALKSGTLQQAIGGFIEKFKPEATYFGLESGQRTGFSSST